MSIKKSFLISTISLFLFVAGFFLFSYGSSAAIGVGGDVGCSGVEDLQTCTRYTDTRGVPYVCQKISGSSDDPDNPPKYACRPQNRGESGIPPIIFESPTVAANFASLICSVTDFISQTVLPPLAVLMMLVVGFLFLTSGGAPQRAGLAQKALLFTAAGVALLVLAPGIVVLIGDLFGSVVVSSSSSCNTITTGTIVGAILKTVNWFSWLVAVTAVAMGLYSGFLYITARDNPQQVQQAAKVLSYVIIGIAVSILAFSIITITKQLMGL